MFATYLLSWKIFWASWKKDWPAQQKAIAQLDSQFERGIPMVSNLMWNVITLTFVQIALIFLADFSPEFRRFCWMTVHLPCLVGSIAYYCYKYGTVECLSSLSSDSLVLWLKNWMAMQGIALVCLTQTALSFFLGILVEPYILPKSWQWSVRYPLKMYEEYLSVCVYFFAGLFLVCLVTLPLSRKGYNLSMETAGRKGVTITYAETFMELMYQTSQSGSLNFTIVPVVLILQNLAGFRVHAIHMIFAALEISAINYTVEFKFCVLHQIMHEIKPLYAMTHVEHHICKGIHPTTSASGLWENWMAGQAIFITTPVGLATIPYAVLQSVYCGANIVVHTMWPSSGLLQWHTLHHTILADVYNVNIPSPYDKQHSKTVQQLQDRLKETSLFVRHEALSDIASFGIMTVTGLFFHYGLGIGAGHVDWSKADWFYHNQP